MIYSYFDDSADETMADHVSCGGIVLRDEFQMNVFEEMWRNQTAGLSEPFHTTDCECQHGQFETWGRNECTALMTRLVDVICIEFMHVGAFASVVPIALYREIFPNSKRADPYRLAVRHTIINMARLARKHNEKIKLWFEDGTSTANETVLYQELKDCKLWNADERLRLSGIDSGDKNLIPLQAADLVAREGMKVGQNLGKRAIRIPLARMWDRAGVILWSSDSLCELRDRGGPDDLGALTTLSDGCYVQENPANGIGRTGKSHP